MTSLTFEFADVAGDFGPAVAQRELVAEDLACRRGERMVFDGLAFRLGWGGALLLTGANGSGKSSLLRLLATLLAPVSGRLLWGKAPVASDFAHYRAQLHYVGHADAIKPALTPGETLAFWAALRGRPSSFTPAAIAPALAAFGLDGVADWPCRWLSAGQRRRLALARLLATPAALWLLDEPNAALDADGQECLGNAVAAHRAGGGRVVIATHLPLALADAQTLSLDDFAATGGDPWAIGF